MFWNKETPELKIEIAKLKAEKRTLKDELLDLKAQKKIEDEDIKHLVRLTQEKQEVELQKKEMALEKAKNEAIATVKDEYRDKLEINLIAQKDDIKEMYAQILERLPDITSHVEIGGKAKG